MKEEQVRTQEKLFWLKQEEDAHVVVHIVITQCLTKVLGEQSQLKK